MKRFMFEKSESISIGRNGAVITTGIEIVNNLHDIAIVPINSKGNATNGCVSVPKCEIRKLINALEEVYAEI